MAKKKSKIIQFQPISLERYVRENGRKLAMGRCFRIAVPGENKQEIIVTRQKKNGALFAGFYLIDMGYLGLTETFLLEFPGYEVFLESVQDKLEHLTFMEEIDPLLAQNIIYGGVEWAEEAGFLPHKDFRYTEFLLDDVEGLDYIEVEFGLNDGPDTNDRISDFLKTPKENIDLDDYYSLAEDLYEEDDNLPNNELNNTAYFRNFAEIQEIENRIGEPDLGSLLLKAIESDDKTEIAQIMLFTVAEVVDNLITDDLDFADKFRNDPEKLIKKTVRDIKKITRGAITSKLIPLPLETVILNNMIHLSAHWALLPKIKEIIATQNASEEFDRMMDITDFMTTPAQRLAAYLFMFSIAWSNENHDQFFRTSDPEDKNIKEAIKVVFENKDFENDDLNRYPGYSDLLEVLDLFKVNDEAHLFRIFKDSWKDNFFTNP